jgi:hypothetical protein
MTALPYRSMILVMLLGCALVDAQHWWFDHRNCHGPVWRNGSGR